MIILRIRTERKGTERNVWKKGTRPERSAEGPRSRTVQNDFKKVGTCPALGRDLRIPGFYIRTILNIEPYSPLKPTKVGITARAEVFKSRALYRWY